WEGQVDVVEVVGGQGDLLEVVDATRAPGRLAGGLDGRQQQPYEHRDDQDDDQELHQSEGAPSHVLNPRCSVDCGWAGRLRCGDPPLLLMRPRSRLWLCCPAGVRTVPGNAALIHPSGR